MNVRLSTTMVVVVACAAGCGKHGQGPTSDVGVATVTSVTSVTSTVATPTATVPTNDTPVSASAPTPTAAGPQHGPTNHASAKPSASAPTALLAAATPTATAPVGAPTAASGGPGPDIGTHCKDDCTSNNSCVEGCLLPPTGNPKFVHIRATMHWHRADHRDPWPTNWSTQVAAGYCTGSGAADPECQRL